MNDTSAEPSLDTVTELLLEVLTRLERIEGRLESVDLDGPGLHDEPVWGDEPSGVDPLGDQSVLSRTWDAVGQRWVYQPETPS